MADMLGSLSSSLWGSWIRSLAVGCLICSFVSLLPAFAAGRRVPLQLKPDDVIPTGNEWISLPDIRAVDGALDSFNVLSMRNRGLLEVTGEGGSPVLQPHF